MPEGDTLFRVAETLRAALLGERLTGFSSPLPALREADLVGKYVAKVETRGKNLLIAFDDGRTLHTHLRMEGSWHLYARGRPWRRAKSGARVVLETERHVAVCFLAPVVRLLSPAMLRRDRALSSLGPDLLSPDFDAQAAISGLKKLHSTPIGEALLDQRTVSGIGNEYKSELLFLHGIDPLAPVSRVTDAELGAVLESARELMHKNVAKLSAVGAPRFRIGPRRTRFASGGARTWVYGRAGEACFRCGARIELRHQGLSRRSTYSCPRCQPARAG